MRAEWHGATEKLPLALKLKNWEHKKGVVADRGLCLQFDACMGMPVVHVGLQCMDAGWSDVTSSRAHHSRPH